MSTPSSSSGLLTGAALNGLLPFTVARLSGLTCTGTGSITITDGSAGGKVLAKLTATGSGQLILNSEIMVNNGLFLTSSGVTDAIVYFS